MNPRLAGRRAALFTNNAQGRGGRGGRLGAEEASTPPGPRSRTLPPLGSPCRGGGRAPKGSSHSPLPAAAGQEPPGESRREGGAAHLVFRKSVDRLPKPGRHGAGPPRGIRRAPGLLGCGAGGQVFPPPPGPSGPARVPPGAGR